MAWTEFNFLKEKDFIHGFYCVDHKWILNKYKCIDSLVIAKNDEWESMSVDTLYKNTNILNIRRKLMGDIEDEVKDREHLYGMHKGDLGKLILLMQLIEVKNMKTTPEIQKLK